MNEARAAAQALLAIPDPTTQSHNSPQEMEVTEETDAVVEKMVVQTTHRRQPTGESVSEESISEVEAELSLPLDDTAENQLPSEDGSFSRTHHKPDPN